MIQTASTHQGRGSRKRRASREAQCNQHKESEQQQLFAAVSAVYSLVLVEPPRIRPVRLAAMRPTFLPAGESRATVVA